MASQRSLIEGFGFGFVLWAFRLRYGEPLRFFDADHLDVQVDLRARGSGRQLETNVRIAGGGQSAAQISGWSIPVRVDDDPALGGTPEPLGESLLARFHEDEVDSTAFRSPVERERRALLNDAKQLGQTTHPIVMNRASCEVADQWFWGELVRFTGTGRELLALDGGKSKLRDGLRRRIRSIDAVFHRPLFLADQAVVFSSAYERNDQLVFSHEIRSGEGETATTHAVALEVVG